MPFDQPPAGRDLPDSRARSLSMIARVSADAVLSGAARVRGTASPARAPKSSIQATMAGDDVDSKRGPAAAVLHDDRVAQRAVGLPGSLVAFSCRCRASGRGRPAPPQAQRRRRARRSSFSRGRAPESRYRDARRRSGRRIRSPALRDRARGRRSSEWSRGLSHRTRSGARAEDRPRWPTPRPSTTGRGRSAARSYCESLTCRP